MARKKRTSPRHQATLPVPLPELGSLSLWCVILFSLLLSALTENFLLSAKYSLAKAKLTTFADLLRKCAGFLRTTSGNSNWPPSVTSSPIMMRGRRLLESIQSALGIDGEENRLPDSSSKKEKENSGDAIPDGDKTGGKATPRKARHPGATQKIQKPDAVIDVEPDECPCCHGREFTRADTHSLYQVLDVVLKSFVKHYIIWNCTCAHCGRHIRAGIPSEAMSGFGSGIAASVALLTSLGVSRRKIQAFFKQACGIDISQGGIQKCLDRASAATKPHYDAIAREVRRSRVAHVDETSSPLFGPAGRKRHWLWAMVSSTLCYFMILNTRSAKAFAGLVGDWAGILVSDGYAPYLKWSGTARQSCLAHLIRKARKFAEDSSPEIARGGRWILAELRRLVKMAHNSPTNGEYAAWKGRFLRCVRKYKDVGGELGTYAATLLREVDHIVTFLYYEGVDPTNNRCERAIRPYVCRRKTSFGSTSLHGEDDISKLLTLHETCRLNGRSTYVEMKTALEHYARGTTPSLYWIRKAGMKAGTIPPWIYQSQRFETLNATP